LIWWQATHESLVISLRTLKGDNGKEDEEVIVHLEILK